MNHTIRFWSPTWITTQHNQINNCIQNTILHDSMITYPYYLKWLHNHIAAFFKDIFTWYHSILIKYHHNQMTKLHHDSICPTLPPWSNDIITRSLNDHILTSYHHNQIQDRTDGMIFFWQIHNTISPCWQDDTIISW